MDNNNLTSTEIFFLKSIEKNVNFFINNTIDEISQKFFTSKSTILRIAEKMGFKNLKAMQIFYGQKKLLSEITTVDVDYLNKLNDINSTVKSISSLTISPIIETAKIIDDRIILNLADSISKKNNLLLFGLGNSNTSLRYFYNVLKRINFPCSIHSSVGGLLTEINFANEHSLILIASNSLKTKEVKYIIDNVKMCDIYIIKNNAVPDIIGENIYCINYVYNTSEKYRFPMISSSVSQQFVLNIIFNLILSKIPRYIEKIKNSDIKVNIWNNE